MCQSSLCGSERTIGPANVPPSVPTSRAEAVATFDANCFLVASKYAEALFIRVERSVSGDERMPLSTNAPSFLDFLAAEEIFKAIPSSMN
jgi:hypothetical protein